MPYHHARPGVGLLERPSEDERRLAGRDAEIADLIGVRRLPAGLGPEEVLVAEVAEPPEDVLGLEDVDAGPQRHREGELVDVQRERRLPARVEEPIDVAAHRSREIAPEELLDRERVAGLEAADDGVVEAEAEIGEQPLQVGRQARRALHHLLAGVGDGVDPLAEAVERRLHRVVLEHHHRQLVVAGLGGAVEAVEPLAAHAEGEVALALEAEERDELGGLGRHVAGGEDEVRIADLARHPHRGGVARRQLAPLAEEARLGDELLERERLAEPILVPGAGEDLPNAVERRERELARVEVRPRLQLLRLFLPRDLPHRAPAPILVRRPPSG